MDAIVVKNLCKTYGAGTKKVTAVDDVSFSVHQGEFFGLLGANGAGKSTTINILTGLLRKDAGEFTILGHNPEKNWEYVKNRMNVSTAYYPLSEILTIEQNLQVYARIYNLNNKEEKIQDLLGLFELKHLAKRRVGDLSSGERTRAALCKGLLNDPEVLFLDECTVGLDPDIAEKTRRIIKSYQQKKGCTVVFTSHYMAEVEELCDRIAFMDKGKILTIASAKELTSKITKNTIELTVKKDAKKFLTFLKKEKITLISAEGNTFVFEVSSERDTIYKVLNKIFAQGYHLSDMHLKKPTLEDVFILFARKNP